MDVVTADGRLVRASVQENGDLFWAARGAASGFFGVVVKFGLKCRKWINALMSSAFIFKSSTHYEKWMTWYITNAPFLSPLVEPFSYAFTRGHCMKDSEGDPMEPMTMGLFYAFGDTEEQSRKALSLLDQCPFLDEALVKAHCIPTTMDAIYQQQADDNPRGSRYARAHHSHG